MSEPEQASGGGSVEYIQHHLTNLCVGNCDPVTHHPLGFWAFDLDTMIISYLLAALMVFVGWRVSSRLNPGVPGGFQNFVESIVEFVSGQVAPWP